MKELQIQFLEHLLRRVPPSHATPFWEAASPVLHQAGLGDALPKLGTPEENLEFVRSDEGAAVRQALAKHLDSFLGGVDLPKMAREFAKLARVSNPMPGISRFKRKNGSIDREMLIEASREALGELRPQIEAGNRGEGRPVRPQKVATQAYPIYCRVCPETPLPKFVSFKDRFKMEPEVSKLLEEAGVVKGPRGLIDAREMERAFMRALNQMHADVIAVRKTGGRQIYLQNVADGAYEIYTKRLLPEKRPDPVYFRRRIAKLAKKPRFAELLRKSGVKLKGSS